MVLRRRALPAVPASSPALPADRIRVVIAGAMSTVTALVASRAFDQLVWPLLAGPAVVTLLVGAVRRRPIATRAIVGLLAVLIGAGLAGVLEGGSAAESGRGFVTGWRRLLTTEWPSPRDPRVVVAIACFLALITAVSVDLAARRRFHLAPLATLAIGLAGAMSVAAPRRPSAWSIVVLAIGAVLLTLLPNREDTRTRIRTLLGERSLPAVLMTLVVAGVAASSAFAWDDRADPRLSQSESSTASVLDPVEEMIALRESEPASDLFRITDRSTLIGRSLPTRWRIAALTEYDGQRWIPAITLRPIGRRLGLPDPSTPADAAPIAFDVEMLSDDFDVLPLPGRPLTVDAEESDAIETDVDRSVVRLPGAADAGVTIGVTAEAPPRLSTLGTATVATRQVDEVAGGFLEEAQQLASGGNTVLEQLDRIERALHDRWNLDVTAPGGQQLALIQRFVTDQRTGTEEQFVTAFVLLARSLGVDARVATGFEVPADELGSPLALRSTHAAVWPEVAIEGLGWIAYDPAPDRANDEPIEEIPQPSAQSPAAAQPPIVPPSERPDEEEQETITDGTGSSRWTSIRRWAVRTGAVVAVATLPFALMVGSILSIKAVRRRRRLRHGDPARRIVGAWANTTDALIDAGLTIGPAWTDQRIADSAGPSVEAVAPGEVHRLAGRATAMTFGATAQAGQLVDESLASWRTIEAALRSQMTLWERIRWRLSVRSLRRRTRTPVAD